MQPQTFDLSVSEAECEDCHSPIPMDIATVLDQAFEHSPEGTTPIRYNCYLLTDEAEVYCPCCAEKGPEQK